jgi:ABC-2 type transport system permease protein
VSAPIQVLLMAGYFLSFMMIPNDPDGTATRVLSFIPIFAPFFMPVRAVFGAPVWEQLVSLGVTLAAVGVLVWAAGRIYSNSVLRTGGRVSLKEALRAGG